MEKDDARWYAEEDIRRRGWNMLARKNAGLHNESLRFFHFTECGLMYLVLWTSILQFQCENLFNKSSTAFNSILCRFTSI